MSNDGLIIEDMDLSHIHLAVNQLIKFCKDEKKIVIAI